MSSVTRFIRQVSVTGTYLSAAAVCANPGDVVFEFVPTAANVVGNYPPGYVQVASAALVAGINQAANAAGGAANLILRDMGKTMLAPVGSASGNQGFFRQVQLLAPGALSASQGFNGGSNGSTFGVLGASNTPDAYTDFLTFFIPVPVAGILNQTTVKPSQAYPLAGQM